MFSLMYTCSNGWTNSRIAVDLKRHDAHVSSPKWLGTWKLRWSYMHAPDMPIWIIIIASCEHESASNCRRLICFFVGWESFQTWTCLLRTVGMKSFSKVYVCFNSLKPVDNQAPQWTFSLLVTEVMTWSHETLLLTWINLDSHTVNALQTPHFENVDVETS